tara:strand:+ start:5994 stop:6365 length:372 start_codon:yes stop_codon:yes gene_type:complete
MKIVLPNLPPKEANPNSNSHYYVRSKVRREQQEQIIGYVLANTNRPPEPLHKAHITITWRASDKRNRDIDNLFSAMKGSLDGLVNVGVLLDDSAKHVSYTLKYEWGDEVKENQTIIQIDKADI